MPTDASAATTLVNPPLRPKIGRTVDLATGRNGRNDPLFYAAAQFSPDYEYYFEDFTAEEYDINIGPFAPGAPHTWQYAEIVSASAAPGQAFHPRKVEPTALRSSCIRFLTSANAGYRHSIRGPLMYTANKSAFIEVRLIETQVTSFMLAVGFANDLPYAAASLGDIDTPAMSNISDAMFYYIDNSQDFTTAALLGRGTTGAAVTKVNVPTGGAAPLTIPTAGAFVTIRVEAVGQSGPGAETTVAAIGYLFVNDSLVATHTAGPDGSALLRPFIFSGAPTAGAGTTVTCDLDYIRCGQQKAGSPF